MTAEPPAPSRARPALALGLWVITTALCLAGFVLLLLTLDVPVSQVYGSRGATGIVAIPFATMGALLATRRPNNPIGWLLSAAGLCTGFVVFGEGYVTYSFAEHDSSLPLTDAIAWLQNWMWVPLVAFGLVYPFLLFPEGQLPSKRWRWLAWFAPPVMLAFGLSIALAPGQLQSVADGFVNPYAVSSEAAESALSILGLPFMAVVALAVVAMAGRFRRSTGDEHEQMKWLLFAGTLTTLTLALNLVAFAGLGGSGGLPIRPWGSSRRRASEELPSPPASPSSSTAFTTSRSSSIAQWCSPSLPGSSRPSTLAS